jgi:aminocarboxymuconate-semialdehyde decarboxylase
MVIDFHAHYLAQEHLQMHEKTGTGHIVGASLRKQENDLTIEANGIPLGRNTCKPEDFYDLATRLEFMSASGIDMQVISPPPFMLFTDLPGATAARLTREQNEAIAQIVRQYPENFRGLGVVPFQDAEIAVSEIAYLMDTLRLSGVEILTYMAGKNLDHPDLDPVWQALDERHALVLIHPNDVLGPERLTKYYLRNLLGNPVETALALACLTFGGVVDRFPHIRFIAAHGGGVAPFVIGRWEHGAQVRPELAHLTASPLDLLRRVYVDSIVHGVPELLYLIEIMGAERIVLGSDAPFDMGPQKPTALFGATLSDAKRQSILTGHQSLCS